MSRTEGGDEQFPGRWLLFNHGFTYMFYFFVRLEQRDLALETVRRQGYVAEAHDYPRAGFSQIILGRLHEDRIIRERLALAL